MPTSGKYKHLNNWAKDHSGLIQLAGLVVTAISLFGAWLLERLSSFITFASTLLIIMREYSYVGVWSGFALIITGLFLRVRTLSLRLSDLEKQTVVLLDKSESTDLANWDYKGDWRSDEGVLTVTNSDDGGLSKSGTSWENYDFIFSFKIMNGCAGWVVRAESFAEYVMIQCNQSRLRVHTRNRIPLLPPYIVKQPEDPERGFKIVKDVPHSLSLREWNTARTEIRGHSIRVFINDRNVFTDHELLRAFPLGKVGFRCYGGECAFFKDIEVVQKAGCSIY